MVLGVREVRAKLYGGRYAEARAATTTGLDMARDVGERFWVGQMLLLSGLLALVEHKPGMARKSLLESVAEQKRCAAQPWLPYSLAALGFAALCAGNRTEAQRYVYEALETEVGNRSNKLLQSLSCAVIAAVLAAEEAPGLNKRAIELYALACCQPLVAKSPFFKDVVGKQINQAAASLSQETVTAAEERGRALDWWETAEELLDELRELGWASDEG